MSPSASTSGWPGSVRSGPTVTRPAPSVSAPLASASRRARPDAWTPAAQITVRAGMCSVVPSPWATVTPVASTPLTSAPTDTATPSSPSARSARADRRGSNAVRTRSAPSSSRMRADPGSIERKSRRRVSRAISPIWPASSTPVGPAPTTTNVSHAARRSGSVVGLGGLERGEDAAPDLDRVLEALEAGRERLPLVVAEVGVPGSGGGDQDVVRDDLGRRGRPPGRW